jgi:hypothetical protein
MLSTVLAQIDLSPSTEFASLSEVTIPSIISALITLILIVAALVFFFMLILGGIKWISSGGDKAQTESARNQITAALIGLVIVFAAWAIITLINTFFGVNILNLTLPTSIV